MAVFTVYLGRDQIQELYFDAGPLLVGRSPECQIQLDLPTVSRRHAMLQRRGSGWAIEDTGGRNGLFVNGRQAAYAELRDGDHIRISRALITFEDNVQARMRARSRSTPRERELRDRLVAILGREGASDPFTGTRSEVLVLDEAALEALDGPTMETLDESSFEVPDDAPAELRWVDAQKGPQALQLGEVLKIGRGPEMDLQVRGLMAFTPLFAEIRQQGEGFVLQRRARLIRLLVNGKSLGSAPHPLEDGDQLELAGTRALFVGAQSVG